jgi:hypothetical protein
VWNELVGGVQISSVGYKYGLVCSYRLTSSCLPAPKPTKGQTKYHDLWHSSHSNTEDREDVGCDDVVALQIFRLRNT